MTTETPGQPCIVLVTIHGIGFEQRPTPGVPMSGYADMLHARLSRALNSGAGPALLSDDPTTQRPSSAGAHPGAAGPVYVESAWPVNTNNREAGLKRLGVWRGQRAQQVAGAVETPAEARLFTPGLPIAHVALVYSHLEDEAGDLDDTVETLVKAAAAFSRYQSAFGAVHMAFNDIMAAVHPQKRRLAHSDVEAASGEPSSLRVRADASEHLPRFGQRAAAKAAETPSPSLGDILLQLQDDVATYVCRNDLRQRVRGFVRDSLLRLIYRDDVAGIVVNAHSQGSVVALDVLSQLSPFEARKIWWLITAGSPLRKYVDLFAWEREIGSVREVGLRGAPGRNERGQEVLPLRWVNFYDPNDPVGDALRPLKLSAEAPATPTDDHTLYRWIDSVGATCHIAIADRKVDNGAHVPAGGLRAHNYWDNEPEFIAPVAGLLRHLVEDRLHAPASQPGAAHPAPQPSVTPPAPQPGTTQQAPRPSSPDDTLILKPK